MTHPNHQTNGASLEDCHTNFFALVSRFHKFSQRRTVVADGKWREGYDGKRSLCTGFEDAQLCLYRIDKSVYKLPNCIRLEGRRRLDLQGVIFGRAPLGNLRLNPAHGPWFGADSDILTPHKRIRSFNWP
uniref:(California timema) hypothetical protein n=1 Tax=Timema californicum TaxID=61474 RepID=A0A7R9IXY7_TIMCA|nr:unnamed protein product [Timema californicum]